MTSNPDQSNLALMLEAAIATTEPSDAGADSIDIARTSCRIPRAVLNEVRAVAHANEMSVSLVINLLLDSYLTGQGRPAYAELAPWYPGYVLRTPAAAPSTISVDNTDG